MKCSHRARALINSILKGRSWVEGVWERYHGEIAGPTYSITCRDYFEFDRSEVKGPEPILEVSRDRIRFYPLRTKFSNTFFWDQLTIFGQKVLKDTYLEMAQKNSWITRADIPGLRLGLERHSEFRKNINLNFQTRRDKSWKTRFGDEYLFR